MTSAGGTIDCSALSRVDSNGDGRDPEQTVPHCRVRRHGLHGPVRGGGSRPLRRGESERKCAEMGRGREKQAAVGRSAEASRGQAV